MLLLLAVEIVTILVMSDKSIEIKTSQCLQLELCSIFGFARSV